jgi:hypothetical protein
MVSFITDRDIVERKSKTRLRDGGGRDRRPTHTELSAPSVDRHARFFTIFRRLIGFENYCNNIIVYKNYRDNRSLSLAAYGRRSCTHKSTKTRNTLDEIFVSGV